MAVDLVKVENTGRLRILLKGTVNSRKLEMTKNSKHAKYHKLR
jgi:hypothetical protein